MPTFKVPEVLRPLLKRQCKPCATEIRQDRQKVMKAWAVIVAAYPETSILGKQLVGIVRSMARLLLLILSKIRLHQH